MTFKKRGSGAPEDDRNSYQSVDGGRELCVFDPINAFSFKPRTLGKLVLCETRLKSGTLYSVSEIAVLTLYLLGNESLVRHLK